MTKMNILLVVPTSFVDGRTILCGSKKMGANSTIYIWGATYIQALYVVFMNGKNSFYPLKH